MPFKFNPFTKKLDIVNVSMIPAGTVTGLAGNIGGSVSPTAGVINVIGDNSVGVNVIGTPLTSTLTISLTNYIEGTATTVGATTATVLSIPMSDTTVTTVSAELSGYESTLPGGVGSSLTASFIRSGAGATLIDAPDDFQNISPSLSAASYSISGSGNNIILTVTGQAGVTINWRAIARLVTAP